MKNILCTAKCAMLLSMILCTTALCMAQDESSTEITGYFQQYRDFSFNTGHIPYNFPATRLNGGGFNVARNLAPWFAMWTQFSFFGSVPQSAGLNVQIIHNLEGVRWQTKQRGPFRLYVKGGLGFANYRFDSFSDTKLSLAYGGGVQIWAAKWMGITLDLSHVTMGLPNLTDLDSREKWDSGLTFTPGLTIRF